MNTDWRTAAAKTLTVVGSVVGITALAGVILILPLKAQQDAAEAQRLGVPDASQRQQICASNMRDISLGLEQYAQDYDETYPTGTQPASDGSPTGVGWAGQMYPYTRTSLTFRCPSDNTEATRPQFAESYGLNSNIVSHPHLSYDYTDLGYTVALFEVRGDRVFLRQPDESASAGATQFSAAGDGTDGGLLARSNGRTSVRVTYATGSQGERPAGTLKQVGPGRHLSGANFALLDGHVEYHLPNEVSTGTDASTSTSPQTGGVRGTAAGVDDPRFQITFSSR